MSASRFWIWPTARSLPGMVREEKITRSPLASFTCGCCSSEMRASAARGSPWLPVHSSTTSSGSRYEKCSWS